MNRRFKVRTYGFVEYDLLANDEDDAAQMACQVNNDRYSDDLTFTSSECVEIPYKRPRGTDRYALVADEIRFGDGMVGVEHRVIPDVERLDGEHWWWTNGHAGVLCDGPEPTDETRRVSGDPAAVLAKALYIGAERVPAQWAPSLIRRGAMQQREATRGQRADDALLRLVECGWPHVEWFVSAVGDCTVPILARSDGKIVGVVMGVR